MIIKFVIYFYSFNIFSINIFCCYFGTSASGCSKDEFFGFGFGQAFNVYVKELCIVGYFDDVKASSNKVSGELPFLFKESVCAFDFQKVAIAILLVKVLNDPVLVARILQRRRARALRFLSKTIFCKLVF